MILSGSRKVESGGKKWLMKKKIEKAITVDDTKEGELFCDECNRKIK